MGIEPTSSAWEAEVIPLYDTRLIKKLYLNYLFVPRYQDLRKVFQ